MRQSKTGKPVRFQITETTRPSVERWIKDAEMISCEDLWSGRVHSGNLRAVQLLLDHTNMDSTVRYVGVDLDDALSLSERIDLYPP